MIDTKCMAARANIVINTVEKLVLEMGGLNPGGIKKTSGGLICNPVGKRFGKEHGTWCLRHMASGG